MTCVSIGVTFSKRAERDVELVNEPRGLIFQSNTAMELFGQTGNELCSETAPRRLPDCRAAFLSPCQLQPLVIDRRCNLDASRAVGQSAVFGRVGAQLIEGETDRQHSCPTDLERDILNDETRSILAVEGLDGGANDVDQFSAGLRCLKQQIMGSAQRHQPVLDSHAALIQAGCGSQALRRNREDRRERILHAMMQFLQQQTLQSPGGLVLGGIEPGLRQDARRVDLGLREQIAKPGIFSFESGETSEVVRHGLPARVAMLTEFGGRACRIERRVYVVTDTSTSIP